MEFKLYSVKNYEIREKDWGNIITKYDDIEKVTEELENDKSYHLRLEQGGQYIFYLDLDNYTKPIEQFTENLLDFFKKKYDLEIGKEKVKYTLNDGKKNSYHISIPSITCTTYKQKEIVSNFKKSANTEIKECIDTTVYSNKWFRLPEQTKGTTKNKPDAILTKHKIINGTMQDFILNYIPKDSINIENKEYISAVKEKEEKVKEKKIKEIKKNENFIKDNGEKKSAIVKMIDEVIKTDYDLIDDLLDMLDSYYYDNYEGWRNIGFILKKMENNTGDNYFKLFNKFSKKSEKYDPKEVKNTYDSFNGYDIKINLSSLHYYAKNSDFEEYKKICRKHNKKINIEISEKYIATCINNFAGDHFIYCDQILYSYNEKDGLWYIECPEVMKKYIANVIYDFLANFLDCSIENYDKLTESRKYLYKLCYTDKGQTDIMKAYRTHFMIDKNQKIEFDSKHDLLGFTNGVYDLTKNKFRNYRYNDYITLTTGYEYKKEEDKKIIDALDQIINKIETDQEKKYLLLQILGTGIIGKSYQKFILFNGAGGNGKSMIDNLNEKTLGNFYYKGKISTLCEPSKGAGSANPEIAFMDKKRLVVFSEPKETQKINNGVMKELTGDKKINARKLYSNDTQTKIHANFILMCNKKIYLEDEATEGEARRIIDFLFESKFTENKDEVDIQKRVFESDKTLLNDNVIEKFKYAYLKILIDQAHKFLTTDNEEFKIPESVKNKSNEYLKKSYIFLEYLNLICEKDENEHIKIRDFVEYLKNTDLYINSTKEERKKLSFKEAVDFFSNNKFTTKNYKERYQYHVEKKKIEEKNCLLGYKFKDALED